MNDTLPLDADLELTDADLDAFSAAGDAACVQADDSGTRSNTRRGVRRPVPLTGLPLDSSDLEWFFEKP